LRLLDDRASPIAKDHLEFIVLRAEGDQFQVIFSDGTGPVIQQSQTPNGSLIAAFAEDQFKATSWLTLNAGLRPDPFFRRTHRKCTSRA